MKIVFRLALLAAAAAAGVWLWTVLFPSPEKIIRKRTGGGCGGSVFQGR